MAEDPEEKHLLDFFYGPDPMNVDERWEKVVREVKELFFRKAILAEEVRPVDEPPATHLPSWFGRVEVGLPGESWPEWGGKPMLPLLQLNCAELPQPVEELAGIEALTVFGTRFPRYDHDLLPNGAGWLIRSYSSREELVPLAEPELKEAPAPFRISWTLVEDDLPYQYAEEMDEQVTKAFCDSLYPLYRAEGGTYSRENFEERLKFQFIVTFYEWLVHGQAVRFGGWPTCPFGYPDPPPGYHYVFEIPMMTGWMWRRDTDIALFYRNMNSPEREWGMFLRPWS